MSSQFIFFCVNIGNEKLLKTELSVFYPELTLSYSRKGFLTYKNHGVEYDPSTISQLKAVFASRVGLNLGKASPEDLLQKIKSDCDELGMDFESCIIHSFSVGTDFVLDAESIFDREVNRYSANGKSVIDVVALGEKEIWYGVHTVDSGITRYPNSRVEIEVPLDSPSKGHLKLAEIIQLYALKFQQSDYWLDFGSAPGGASMYLLDKGCKVWGIDPAKVSQSITENKNYTHILTPVQDLSQESLPDDIHWVHADLNLKPTQAIKEVLRLIKKYHHSLKGVIFTVQLPNLDYIENLEDFEDQFYDWGFSDILSTQVPSHKQEYTIIARR
jgi:hypothetical protein